LEVDDYYFDDETKDTKLIVNIFNVTNTIQQLCEIQFDMANFEISKKSNGCMLFVITRPYDSDSFFIKPIFKNSIHYDKFKIVRPKKIKISCVSAKKLISCDANGKSDPCCVLFFPYNLKNPEKKFTTKRIKETLNPVFIFLLKKNKKK
jgi:hypothetical protein